MILCDREIQQAIHDGRLVIDPAPDDECYDTTSVDLRLGTEFFKWDLERLERQFGRVPAIDIGSYNYSELSSAYLRPVAPDDQGCALLQPQQFMLAQTRETIGFRLEGGLAGRVEGKSSLARLGLSVHFAPTLHCGWRGRITLELHNVGVAPLTLRPDARVCQLIVEPVRGTPSGTMDSSIFQDQERPHGTGT